MSSSNTNVTVLAGRILMSAVFLFSGISKIAAFSTMAGFAQAKGLPLPEAAIGIAAAIEIIGGLFVLVGFQTRVSAWVLALYLIPTTLIFHNFWAMQGMDRMDNQGHFLKNFAIIGGLLILASYGAGGFSVDASRVPKQ
ncbi:MAG: DoxX family protein [Candidatus Acidiferrales bacterium]